MLPGHTFLHAYSKTRVENAEQGSGERGQNTIEVRQKASEWRPPARPPVHAGSGVAKQTQAQT